MAQNEGKYVEIKIVNGEIRAEDLSVDTRTFIFEEVATSALRHNYLIWGRTPARGNDSRVFGYASETGKNERHSNEVCHPNVFTWLGIIGLLLYSFIYFQSSYLAFFKSRSIYMKLLGLFIAFRWAFGWIEDFNRFDIANISLWILIAMGFSKQFRQMDNLRFKRWLYNTLSLKNKIYEKILWLCNMTFSEEKIKTTASWLQPLAELLQSSGKVQLFSISLGNIKEVQQTSYHNIQQWILPNLNNTHYNQIASQDTCKLIAKIEAEISPDLVHIWGTESIWASVYAKKYIKATTIIDIQGLLSSYYYYYYGGLTFNEIIKCISLKEILMPWRTLFGKKRVFSKEEK